MPYISLYEGCIGYSKLNQLSGIRPDNKRYPAGYRELNYISKCKVSGKWLLQSCMLPLIFYLKLRYDEHLSSLSNLNKNLT